MDTMWEKDKEYANVTIHAGEAGRWTACGRRLVNPEHGNTNSVLVNCANCQRTLKFKQVRYREENYPPKHVEQ